MSDHVIKLLASGTCHYEDEIWHAVLVTPFLSLLRQNDPLALVAQVRVVHHSLKRRHLDTCNETPYHIV